MQEKERDIPENHTLYVKNLSDRVKKHGNR